MRSKKGSISMEMIIIIILAVLVLVIVAAAFSGGMNQLWQKITGVYQQSTAGDESIARLRCDNFCTLNDYQSWCATKFNINNVTKSCKEVGATCTAAGC